MAYRKPQRFITAEASVLSTEEKNRLIYRLIDQAGEKMFGAHFIAKDGTLRKMVARTGVQKDLKGVGLNYNPRDVNNAVVFDMNAKNRNRLTKGAYRTINLDTTQYLKVNGDEYNFTEQKDGSWYVLRTPKDPAELNVA